MIFPLIVLVDLDTSAYSFCILNSTNSLNDQVNK